MKALLPILLGLAAGVVVTVGVELSTCDVILGPEIDSHGFADDPGPILSKAADAVRAAIMEMNAGSKADIQQIQKAVRQATQRVIRAGTSRKPVVIPVVLEM